MTNEEIKTGLRRVKLSIMAHPDCEEGSEFADMVSAIENIEQSLDVVPHNTVVSLPFTDEQLKVIGLALEAFLKEDTVIVDDNNKVHDEMVITLRNDAQGIGYYLGLEDVKPKYFKGTN